MGWNGEVDCRGTPTYVDFSLAAEEVFSYFAPCEVVVPEETNHEDETHVQCCAVSVDHRTDFFE